MSFSSHIYIEYGAESMSKRNMFFILKDIAKNFAWLFAHMDWAIGYEPYSNVTKRLYFTLGTPITSSAIKTDTTSVDSNSDNFGS